MEPIEEAYTRGYNALNDFQRDILQECIEKGSGGISVPLGTGKTIISLVLGMYYAGGLGMPVEEGTNGKILVVASKTLIQSWVAEIKKFLGDSLPFIVFHKSLFKKDWSRVTIPDKVRLVLVTKDVTSQIYRESNMGSRFIDTIFIPHSQNPGMRNGGFGVYMNHFGVHMNHLGAFHTFYKHPTEPFLQAIEGPEILYSTRWSSVIFDEIQKYTNIDTPLCQSLGAICSPRRWALSGTLFNEPKVERILGYFVIMDIEGMPRTKSDTQALITSSDFKGLNSTIIERTENLAFVEKPRVNEQIVYHKMSGEEEKIYTMMRTILKSIRERAKQAHMAFMRSANEIDRLEAREEYRKFTSYKMVLILYLREVLVCPLLPVTSVVIESSDMRNRNELSTIIMNELQELGLDNWLKREESAKSSRMEAVINTIDSHRDERIIVFCCFKAFLDVLEHFMTAGRPVFRLKSSMSMEKRGEMIKEFAKVPDGVLLTTYELAAEGLNLQFAATVLLVDFWWNASKTQQAIGRIFRFGQKAKEIFVYYFTSNTGVEKILFEKQKAKLDIMEELKVGAVKTKIPKVKMDDIIRLLIDDGNSRLIRSIRYY